MASVIVKVTTKSNSWTTPINTDLDGAKKYFLGNYFNVGVFPEEKMEKVLSVEEIK